MAVLKPENIYSKTWNDKHALKYVGAVKHIIIICCIAAYALFLLFLVNLLLSLHLYTRMPEPHPFCCTRSRLVPRPHPPRGKGLVTLLAFLGCAVSAFM